MLLLIGMDSVGSRPSKGVEYGYPIKVRLGGKVLLRAFRADGTSGLSFNGTGAFSCAFFTCHGESIAIPSIFTILTHHGMKRDMISKDTQQDIIAVCHLLSEKDWVANHDGNVSSRLGENCFAATPTARAKRDLQTEDLIEVDAKGKQLAGKGKPFSELAVHLRVYQARPDVGAVVHSHAPNCTAVGCANQEMMTWSIPEAVVSLGPGVPLVGLAMPNSEALWSELDALLPHYDTIMVAGNGIFSWGPDLETAYLRMELAEHLAKILLTSVQLGGPTLLSRDQINELLKKREKAGLGRPADPNRPHWFMQ